MRKLNAGKVKIRSVFLPGGAALLHESLQPGFVNSVQSLAVLKRSYPAVEPRDILRLPERRILAHQGHRHVAGCEGLRDPVQHPPSVVQISRQHQMPQDHTLFHQPVFIVHRPSHLTEHLPYGFAGRGKVILRSGERPCQRAVGIFQVR